MSDDAPSIHPPVSRKRFIYGWASVAFFTLAGTVLAYWLIFLASEQPGPGGFPFGKYEIRIVGRYVSFSGGDAFTYENTNVHELKIPAVFSYWLRVYKKDGRLATFGIVMPISTPVVPALALGTLCFWRWKRAGGILPRFSKTFWMIESTLIAVIGAGVLATVLQRLSGMKTSEVIPPIVGLVVGVLFAIFTQLRRPAMTVLKPRWFTIAFRLLATTVVVGLAGGVFHELYRVSFPHAVVATFGGLAAYGSMAFIILQWVGAWLSYVRVLDATLYTMLFVVMACAGTLFVVW